MPDAGTLNCLMCGAPTRSDATACEHCGARLATVACPSCFAMIFQGSTFCPHCGSRADRAVGEASGIACPHCQADLTNVSVGKSVLAECPKCDGLWVDKFSFEQICSSHEEQAAVLGSAEITPVHQTSLEVRYVRCPQCTELMHRVNFAQTSGVVLDVCKPHGTWFDAHELQRIVQFIRGGGLDRARSRQIRELEESRRRLEQARDQLYAADHGFNQKSGLPYDVDLSDIVHAARGLLRLFR